MARLRGYTNASVTIIQVNDTTTFPTNGGVVSIEDEQILYSTATDSQLLGCTRGYNGSDAVEHQDGTLIELVSEEAALNILQEYSGSGAPVDNVTGVKQIPTAARYTDLDTGDIYVNTGTLDNPAYSSVGGATASGPEGAVQLANSEGGLTHADALQYDIDTDVLTLLGPLHANGGEITSSNGLRLEANTDVTLKSDASGHVVRIEPNSDDYSELQIVAGGGYITFCSGNNTDFHGQIESSSSGVRLNSIGAHHVAMQADKNGAAHILQLDADGRLALDNVDVALKLAHGFNSSTANSGDFDSTTPTAVGPSLALAVSKASNKVNIRTNFTYRFVDASSRYLAYFQLYMDSTPISTGIIAVGTTPFTVPMDCQDMTFNGHVEAEVTPGDTSSHTYQLYMFVDVSTVSGGHIRYGAQPQFNVTPVNNITADEISA